MTEDNGLATLEQLFSKPTRRRYKLLDPLPVSGHRLRIRSLTEGEMSRYQSATIASGGTGLRKSRLEDANRRLIKLCVVDGEGNPLLEDSHLEKLTDWDSADTTFLYDECASHCGVNRRDVEDLVKKSEKIHVEDSPLPSPSA